MKLLDNKSQVIKAQVVSHLDSHLFSELGVGGFDERDVLPVGVVVDVLKTLEDVQASLAALVGVWRSKPSPAIKGALGNTN